MPTTQQQQQTTSKKQQQKQPSSRVNFHHLPKQKKSNPPSKKSQSIGHYILGKTIGQGTFGKVKLGNHILTNQKVAVKILQKERITQVADIQRVSRQIHILKLIRHPHIIQLYQIIQTPKQLYMIMEYCPGGELFDYIVDQGRVKEEDSRRFLQQIMSGVEYLHKLNIVHRDLKPQNLLLDRSKKSIKIVDFGLSNTYKRGELLKTACGSPCYAAPEMIAGNKYNGLGVDIWSCGVILFALICGYLPFEDPNTAVLYKKILDGNFKIPKFVGYGVRNLIQKVLVTDPENRLKFDQIRKHKWFLGEKMEDRRDKIVKVQGLNQTDIDQDKQKKKNNKVSENVQKKKVRTQDKVAPQSEQQYSQSQSQEEDQDESSQQINEQQNSVSSEGIDQQQPTSQTPTKKPPYPTADQGLMVGYNHIPIDTQVLNQLQQFGFNTEFTQKCLDANKHTHQTTTYYLLLKKKARKMGISVQILMSAQTNKQNLAENNSSVLNKIQWLSQHSTSLSHALNDSLKNNKIKKSNQLSKKVKTQASFADQSKCDESFQQSKKYHHNRNSSIVSTKQGQSKQTQPKKFAMLETRRSLGGSDPRNKRALDLNEAQLFPALGAYSSEDINNPEVLSSRKDNQKKQKLKKQGTVQKVCDQTSQTNTLITEYLLRKSQYESNGGMNDKSSSLIAEAKLLLSKAPKEKTSRNVDDMELDSHIESSKNSFKGNLNKRKFSRVQQTSNNKIQQHRSVSPKSIVTNISASRESQVKVNAKSSSPFSPKDKVPSEFSYGNRGVQTKGNSRQGKKINSNLFGESFENEKRGKQNQNRVTPLPNLGGYSHNQNFISKDGDQDDSFLIFGMDVIRAHLEGHQQGINAIPTPPNINTNQPNVTSQQGTKMSTQSAKRFQNVTKVVQKKGMGSYMSHSGLSRPHKQQSNRIKNSVGRFINNENQIRANSRGNISNKITAKRKVDLRSYASLNVTLGTAKTPQELLQLASRQGAGVNTTIIGGGIDQLEKSNIQHLENQIAQQNNSIQKKLGRNNIAKKGAVALRQTAGAVTGNIQRAKGRNSNNSSIIIKQQQQNSRANMNMVKRCKTSSGNNSYYTNVNKDENQGNNTSPNPPYMRISPPITQKHPSKNTIKNNINHCYSTQYNNGVNRIDQAQSYILSSSPFDISTNQNNVSVTGISQWQGQNQQQSNNYHEQRRQFQNYNHSSENQMNSNKIIQNAPSNTSSQQIQQVSKRNIRNDSLSSRGGGPGSYRNPVQPSIPKPLMIPKYRLKVLMMHQQQQQQQQQKPQYEYQSSSNNNVKQRNNAYVQNKENGARTNPNIKPNTIIEKPTSISKTYTTSTQVVNKRQHQQQQQQPQPVRYSNSQLQKNIKTFPKQSSSSVSRSNAINRGGGENMGRYSVYAPGATHTSHRNSNNNNTVRSVSTTANNQRNNNIRGGNIQNKSIIASGQSNITHNIGSNQNAGTGITIIQTPQLNNINHYNSYNIGSLNFAPNNDMSIDANNNNNKNIKTFLQQYGGVGGDGRILQTGIKGVLQTPAWQSIVSDSQQQQSDIILPECNNNNNNVVQKEQLDGRVSNHNNNQMKRSLVKEDDY